MYRQTDKFLKSLKIQIRNEFNHLSVLSFDELNVTSTKKETTELYSRLLNFNQKGYFRIVEESYEYALDFLTEEQKKKLKSKTFDVDYLVDYVLENYNWVTGYLYKREAERKRLRLAEEMMTAKEFFDRKKYSSVINKNANLWYTQSSQYAIDMADNTVLNTWKSAGVEKVVWVAEHDDKTCGECNELDEQVFDIDNVPHKPHYGCRCTIIPYTEDISNAAE